MTDSKKLYDELRMVRNHGMIRGYDSEAFGLNLRMPEVSAAIAKVQMGRLPSFLEKRRANARALSRLLDGADHVTIPEQRAHEEINWYLYTISTGAQGELKKALNAAGFGASVYYPIPVHQIPFYATAMKGRRGKLPVTERAAGTRTVAARPSGREATPLEENERDRGQDRVRSSPSCAARRRCKCRGGDQGRRPAGRHVRAVCALR